MKKVLSLVLAAVMAFGMATVGFAATIEGETSNYTNVLGGSGYVSGKGSDTYWALTEDGGSTDLGDAVAPGSKYYVAMYVGDYDATTGKWGDRTTAAMSRDKITVKTKITKGSALIKEVKFKNVTVKNFDKDINGDSYDLKTVVIQVEFIDPFVSTKPQEFDFTTYLAYKGSKINDTEITITGELKNEVIEVDEDDSVNLSDGQVAECIGYTKGIEIDTGNGLFITTNMFQDKKYYAKSVQEIKAADDEITAKYPEIDTIYYLYTVNMTSASNVVTFDIDDKYFVYNESGKYIGTTADKLPLSKKYYLTTKKIDMEGDVSEVPADENGDSAPVDVESPITGGDDVPANVNDNPGTGANGFVNVAVVAGMIALAAAGAVSIKK